MSESTDHWPDLTLPGHQPPSGRRLPARMWVPAAAIGLAFLLAVGVVVWLAVRGGGMGVNSPEGRAVGQYLAEHHRDASGVEVVEVRRVRRFSAAELEAWKGAIVSLGGPRGELPDAIVQAIYRLHYRGGTPARCDGLFIFHRGKALHCWPNAHGDQWERALLSDLPR